LVGYGAIRFVLENFRPENDIWKMMGVPVAMIFGMVAIGCGGYLIFRKKQS
jgi:prolipoprotein diacylglyceryltransferase